MQGSCQSAKGSAFLHATPTFLQLAMRLTEHRKRATTNQLRDSCATAPNRHLVGELRSKPGGINANRPLMDPCEVVELAYKMIAERDNETVKVERTSTFVIVAKARVWASEGWQVVITDADGKSYQLAEFDQLLAA
jgi:hypothetical protein